MQRAAAVAATYWSAAEAHRRAVEDQALPSSPIGRAHRTKRLRWHPDMAALRLVSAHDHVNTLTAVLVAGQFSHQSAYTLVRGILEADAVACWLLTTTSARERRRRRIIDRGFQAYWRLQFQGKETDRRSGSIARQIRSVLPAARSRASTIDVLKTAKSSRPSMASLVTDLLSANSAATSRPVGSMLYNLVSGFAHGEVWTTAMGTVAGTRMSPLASIASVSGDVRRFIIVLSWLFPAHEVVMERWLTLADADSDSWKAVRDQIPDLPSLK